MPHTPDDQRDRLISSLAAQDEPAAMTSLEDLIGADVPTELYLFILSNAPVTQSDLERHGYRGAAYEAGLAILEARGMARTDGSGWWVTPPQEALPALARQLESRASTIRAALPGLTAAYRNTASSSSTGLLGTEQLSGAHQVAFAYAQCFADAHSEARGMRVRSMATRGHTFDALPGASEGRLNASGRAVTVRTVIDTDLVAGFTRADFAALQQAPNLHVTLAAGVPFTAAVNDRGMAVVETYSDGRVDGLILRDPNLVAAVSATVDLLLRLSAPLSLHKPGVDVITEEERAILVLMASGVPDATIARRVGISPRTLDRRIRGLLDRLNATTRFQAGAQASARGWL